MATVTPPVRAPMNPNLMMPPSPFRFISSFENATLQFFDGYPLDCVLHNGTLHKRPPPMVVAFIAVLKYLTGLAWF
jgi:hypothetical protein